MVQTADGLGRIMVPRPGFYRVRCCDHTPRAFTGSRNIPQLGMTNEALGIGLVVQRRDASRVPAAFKS